jgi:hypothetical protein
MRATRSTAMLGKLSVAELGKGKFVPVFKHHAMKMYRRSGDIASSILHLIGT